MRYTILFLPVLLIAGLLLAGPLFHGRAWALSDARERSPATAAEAKSPVPDTFKKTDWPELVPEDWNPLGEYADMDFDELEDDDPRVDEIMEKLQTLWDKAPANPDLEGALIRIPGYVVPVDFSDESELTEFLLVPYFGACIHVPPPPANQIIHVTLEKTHDWVRMMEAVWVSGKLSIDRAETEAGQAAYRLQASGIERYEPED